MCEKTAKEIKVLTLNALDIIKTSVNEIAKKTDTSVIEDVALGRIKYLCEVVEENIFVEKKCKQDLIESVVSVFGQLYDIFDVLEETTRFEQIEEVPLMMYMIEKFCTGMFQRDRLDDMWMTHKEWWD